MNISEIVDTGLLLSVLIPLFRFYLLAPNNKLGAKGGILVYGNLLKFCYDFMNNYYCY